MGIGWALDWCWMGIGLVLYGHWTGDVIRKPQRRILLDNNYAIPDNNYAIPDNPDNNVQKVNC